MSLFGQEIKSEDIYLKSIGSIVTLKVEKKGGAKVQGTAFFAIKDGMAVTAWHVVRDAVSVKAKFASGEEFDVSGLVDSDPARDIAIVRVKAFGTPLLSVGATPSVGQKAYVVGAPLGLEFTISDGLLSQIQVMDGTKAYQFSCPASPGNSGGPLLNAKGEIIGVVSFQFKSGQNLNFAVPIQYALGLDTSLPTKPWDQVRVVSTSSEVVSIKDTDKNIVKIISCIQGADVSNKLIQRELIIKKNGYKDTIPSIVFRVLDESNSILKKVSNQTISDPIRSKLVSTLIIDLNKAVESLNLRIKAIQYAQQHNGWRPENNEMVSRSFAMFPNSTVLNSDELKELKEKDDFKDNMDRIGLITFGIWDRSVKKLQFPFQTGITTMRSYPLWITDVKEDSLADKLGFQKYDVLRSINGNPAIDTYQLKEELILNQGKTMTIVITRSNKEKELTPRIPEDLIKYK
jgi:S1-C subfamily serine protease